MFFFLILCPSPSHSPSPALLHPPSLSISLSVTPFTSSFITANPQPRRNPWMFFQGVEEKCKIFFPTSHTKFILFTFYFSVILCLMGYYFQFIFLTIVCKGVSTEAPPPFIHTQIVMAIMGFGYH